MHRQSGELCQGNSVILSGNTKETAERLRSLFSFRHTRKPAVHSRCPAGFSVCLIFSFSQSLQHIFVSDECAFPYKTGFSLCIFTAFKEGWKVLLWPAAAAGDAKGVRKGTGYLVRRTLLFYDAIIALPCRYDKAFVISALFLVKTRW